MSLIETKAFRNIPTAYPRKHLFNEEINTGLEQDKLIDWANVTSGIIHERASSVESKNTWHKYGDIEGLNDFLFNKVQIPKSRFTDGSYPIWYGSEDIDTSLKEIEFHLKRDTSKEIESGFIIYERAVCEADLSMKNNHDVKYLKTSLKNYHDPSSYDDCIAEFKKLKKQGIDSLTYSSARSLVKECYAITKKEEIKSSIVIKFFNFMVYRESNRESEISEIILTE